MSKIKKIMIFIIIGIFVITAAFVGTLFWMKSKANAEAEKDQQEQHQVHTIFHRIEESITVNIKDSKQMLRVKAVVEMKSESEQDQEILSQLGLVSSGGHGGDEGGSGGDSILVPSIITVLRSKTLEDVSETNSHKKIGEEAANQLNHDLHTDTFVNVNFVEFIYK